MQAFEDAQPGIRQLAAMAACLPCFMAALGNTIAAFGKGQKFVSDYGSTCREAELLLQAQRSVQSVLTSSEPRFLETMCTATQSSGDLHSEQSTRSQPRNVRSRLRLASAHIADGMAGVVCWLPTVPPAAERCAVTMAAFDKYADTGGVLDALTQWLQGPTAALVDVMAFELPNEPLGKQRLYQTVCLTCHTLGKLAMQPMHAAGAGLRVADTAAAAAARAAAAACSFLRRQADLTDYNFDCSSRCGAAGIGHCDWAVSAMAGLVLRLPPGQVAIVAEHGALAALMGALLAACHYERLPAGDRLAMCSTACAALHALALKHPPSRSSLAEPTGPGSWTTMLATLQLGLPRRVHSSLSGTFAMVSQAVGPTKPRVSGSRSAAISTGDKAAGAPHADAVAAAEAAMAELLKVICDCRDCM